MKKNIKKTELQKYVNKGASANAHAEIIVNLGLLVLDKTHIMTNTSGARFKWEWSKTSFLHSNV